MLIGWQQAIGESRVLNSEMTLASTGNIDVIITLAVAQGSKHQQGSVINSLDENSYYSSRLVFE